MMDVLLAAKLYSTDLKCVSSLEKPPTRYTEMEAEVESLMGARTGVQTLCHLR